MKYNKQTLYLIIAFGALLRFLFLFWGADIYYGKNIFIFGDSFSYANSFINLWEHGLYSIWLDVPESYTGRGPGYPFFWGLHYLVFGAKYAYFAVAVSQIILDVIAIKLIFDILKTISSKFIVGLFGAFAYACYPFVIIWLTITGTESFASFLVILILWIFYVKKESFFKYGLLGLLIAYATLTRPYLGIFLPFLLITIFLIEKNKIIFLKKAVLTGACFALLYSPWPIRNYVNHQQLVVFNSPTSGYQNFQKDFNSFRSWVYAWEPYSALINDYRIQVAEDTTKLKVPNFVFANESERIEFDYLIEKCRSCGSSFYYWKEYHPYKGVNCNDEIEKGFIQLKKSFVEKNKFHYYIKVPSITLSRAIFKIGKAESKTVVDYPLFIGRILSILIGFLGAIYFIFHQRKMLLMAIYPIFWYMFLSFNHMQFEIRYLLQADIILLLLSVLFVERLYIRFKREKVN